LLRPASDLEFIDTPGVRAFGLWGIHADSLERYYPELQPFIGHCRFGDCRHDREPGCALLEAVGRGAIPARRWQSFLGLRAEIAG
jgi:ribosome biogenesis GTPase